MAKVIKQFIGQADGDAYPRVWKVGEEVPAGTDLERVAMEQGWCKKKPAPRNKSLKGAPANKSASARPARASRKKTAKRFKRTVKK
jgi:hypothetical protein